MGAESRAGILAISMADVVSLEQFDRSKNELLRQNPDSVLELASSLAELSKLVAAGEIGPQTVYSQAAMINQPSPLPRNENFAAGHGMPPRRHQVVGELFPNITLRGVNGLTTVESLLYVDVGDDPFNNTVHLGPKNQWNYDGSGNRLITSPIRDAKWWERIVWRKYVGPFSQDHVIESDKGAFVYDSRGQFWEVISMKDHFRGNEYQDALQVAKARPEAVRLAVAKLIQDLGVVPKVTATAA